MPEQTKLTCAPMFFSPHTHTHRAPKTNATAPTGSIITWNINNNVFRGQRWHCPDLEAAEPHRKPAWTYSPSQTQVQVLLVTGSEYTAILENPSCLSSRRHCCLGLDARSLNGSEEGDKVHRIPKRQHTLRPLSYSLEGPKLSKARDQVCRAGSHLTQTRQRAREFPCRLSKAIPNSGNSQKLPPVAR